MNHGIKGFPPDTPLGLAFAPNIRAYQVAGTYSYTVPAHVKRIIVELWGGGAGAADGGVGLFDIGHSGGYALASLDVTPGEVLTITVGAGGTNAPTNGSDSHVKRSGITLALAAGGGSATAQVGTVKIDGIPGMTHNSVSMPYLGAPRGTYRNAQTQGNGLEPGGGGNPGNGAGNRAGAQGWVLIYEPEPTVIV